MEDQHQENIDMIIDEGLLRNMALNSPLALLGLEDENLKDIANKFIPFSTGFEIECYSKPEYNLDTLRKEIAKVPYIIQWNFSSDEYRFRIPNGIRGIICLHNISLFCKRYLTLNEKSGIHYHVDFSDVWTYYRNYDNFDSIIRNHSNWILEELDTWGYKGTYNSRRISTSREWVTFNALGTIEFRIGEMTFDHNLLLKRIMHCNKIVSNLRDKIDSPYSEKYSFVDRYDIIEYLKEFKSDTGEKQDEISVIYDRMRQKIKNRVIEVTW